MSCRLPPDTAGDSAGNREGWRETCVEEEGHVCVCVCVSCARAKTECCMSERRAWRTRRRCVERTGGGWWGEGRGTRKRGVRTGDGPYTASVSTEWVTCPSTPTPTPSPYHALIPSRPALHASCAASCAPRVCAVKEVRFLMEACGNGFPSQSADEGERHRRPGRAVHCAQGRRAMSLSICSSIHRSTTDLRTVGSPACACTSAAESRSANVRASDRPNKYKENS